MNNIYSNIYQPSLFNLKKAKKNIENNNVIALPTETVYGLAGNAYSNSAVKKIFKLKKRPLFNPLIIHFKNLKDLKDNVICNASFIKLHKALCPGPITFILKINPKSKISKIARAGKKTVAVRIPKHKYCYDISKKYDKPITTTSVNRSGEQPLNDPKKIIEIFGDGIDLLIDDGKINNSAGSKIYELKESKPIQIR